MFHKRFVITALVVTATGLGLGIGVESLAETQPDTFQALAASGR